jgi:hypothetical protein
LKQGNKLLTEQIIQSLFKAILYFIFLIATSKKNERPITLTDAIKIRKREKII